MPAFITLRRLPLIISPLFGRIDHGLPRCADASSRMPSESSSTPPPTLAPQPIASPNPLLGVREPRAPRRARVLGPRPELSDRDPCIHTAAPAKLRKNQDSIWT